MADVGSRLRACCCAGVVTLLLVTQPVPEARARGVAGATVPPVRSSFFGVHHSWLGVPGPRGWPQAPVGSVRLWDDGVTWRDLEPSPGTFDLTRLDGLVAQARSHGASVLLVLGQTPAFHAVDPAAPGFFGPGATSMPRRDAWSRYVQTLAVRHRDVWGGRVAFQVWNEGNNPQYWSGSPAQLAQLTRWTEQALHAVEPAARLVAPAMDTRLPGQLDVLAGYLAQRPGGRPVTDYVDAVAVHLYPPQDAGPEQAGRQLRDVRRLLGAAGVPDLPVWDTEINYGLVGGPDNGGPGSYGPGSAPPPLPLPDDLQAAYVLRTYLLQASYGVRRVYWYAWDRIDLMNTWMVEADYVTPTPAGRSFGVAREWIVGTRPTGCRRDAAGTRRCGFAAGDGLRTAVWNPDRVVPLVVDEGTTSYDTADGTRHPVDAGSTLEVGPVPVLLRSGG